MNPIRYLVLVLTTRCNLRKQGMDETEACAWFPCVFSAVLPARMEQALPNLWKASSGKNGQNWAQPISFIQPTSTEEMPMEKRGKPSKPSARGTEEHPSPRKTCARRRTSPCRTVPGACPCRNYPIILNNIENRLARHANAFFLPSFHR